MTGWIDTASWNQLAVRAGAPLHDASGNSIPWSGYSITVEFA